MTFRRGGFFSGQRTEVGYEGLFLVYSEGRDTLSPGARSLQNRSVAVKLTRLIRF